MMLTIYHSNQLDMLKTITAALITGRPLRDPFQPEVIIVQSNSIAQWIQLELAANFGIAANLELPRPASFIWQMFTRILPDIPEESALVKYQITWRLMALLPRLCQQPDCEVISEYLRDDNDHRKCFQFSARLAELFEQYMVYRPDWLENWQRGKLIANVHEKTQRWQASLWRVLIDDIAQSGQPIWHYANIYQRFIHTLVHSTMRPPGLPDRVFICGISSLPPTYLKVFQALGKHIDIHLLFTNPCRYYWGDILDHAVLRRLLHRHRWQDPPPTEQALFRRPAQAELKFNTIGEQHIGNPLLASWGKLGRDHIYLLAQMEGIAEVDAFVEPAGNTLLSLLQRDILELENHTVISSSLVGQPKGNDQRPLRLDDRSLSLHVCHSTQREVEVLHDSLLAMMVEDQTLRPREIIVMVADIERYTPAIQAVFGNAGNERYLPFAISDRRVRHIHPVLPAFFSILELPCKQHVDAKQVLALLEVPALAARFAINEPGLRLLRQYLEKSCICWGLGLDDTKLSELMYATGQHIRQLAELLMQLRKWRDLLAQHRSIAAWINYICEIINDFFMPDADAEAALALLEKQCQQVLKCCLQVGYNQPVPVTILQYELAARLDQEQFSQQFFTGTINFCSMMPMRSLAFRVICILGMNDSAYPRSSQPAWFNLMAQQPRSGDRCQRDDDRYMFLEALFSAQQRMYISFIGRDIQDNTPRYPSVLVSELIDYIAHSFYLLGDEYVDAENRAKRVRAHLWQWHSRMPFAPENFLAGSEHQSFAKEWLPAASAKGKPIPDFIAPLKAPPCYTLALDELLCFYHHPVRAWFVQRLALSVQQKSLEQKANEPFNLNGFTRYKLNNQLVNALINGENIDLLFQQWRAAGLLPDGAFGELYFAKQYQDMMVLYEKVRQWRLPETQRFQVSLTVNDIKLSGWLQRVQVNGLLRWRPGTLSNRDGLRLWLEHLAYCAMGGEGESRMFGAHGEWWFAPMNICQAKKFLQVMVTGYCQGMSSPLLLLPRSGGAWLSNSYDAMTKSIDRNERRQVQARNKLIQAWQGNYHIPGECTDPYLQLLIRQLDAKHIEAMILAAERYLLPSVMFNKAQS